MVKQYTVYAVRYKVKVLSDDWPVFPLHSFSHGGPPHQKSSPPRLQLLSNIIVTEQDLNFGVGLRLLIIILLIPQVTCLERDDR